MKSAIYFWMVWQKRMWWGEGEARREHAGTSEVRQQLLNLNEGYICRCSRSFLSKFTVGF